jgi:hypothetical protein
MNKYTYNKSLKKKQSTITIDFLSRWNQEEIFPFKINGG